MALAYSSTARNNRLDEITALIDGGSGAGKLRIYNGTRPSTGLTATTLLAECLFTDPAAPAASGGVLTMSAIADGTGLADFDATWFRVVDSDNVFVMDGNVGTISSDLNLNTISIVTGINVVINSFVITGGNA